MIYCHSTVEGMRTFPKGFTLYLSGPMSGMPEHNFPAFHRWADKLSELGFRVINPATLNLDFVDYPWEFYLRRDLKALLDCEGIFMMENWTKSKGARLEFYVAQQLKFQTLYYDQEISE